MTISKRRMEEIDGLRGIAALSVMLGHWGEAIQKQGPPAEVGHLLQGLFLDYWSFGRLGIVAFFCISGFVVPFSFRGDRPMVSFPISRIFRLYPAYWTSIFLAIVVFPMVSGPKLTVDTILANMTMIQLALQKASVLGVYWTLLIELVFYGVCYAMFGFKILHNVKANIVMMCLFLFIALAGGAYRWVHPENDFPLGIPTYLAAMHFGTIARLRMLDGKKLRPKLYPMITALLIISVVAANTLAYLRAQNELVGWIAANLAYVTGVALFLLCIHRQWFKGSVLAFFGLISYSMYLFHMILIIAFREIWPATISNWFVAAMVYTPVYFALTIMIATLVHHFIEKPSIKFGRSLENFVVGRLRFRTT